MVVEGDSPSSVPSTKDPPGAGGGCGMWLIGVWLWAGDTNDPVTTAAAFANPYLWLSAHGHVCGLFATLSGPQLRSHGRNGAAF